MRFWARFATALAVAAVLAVGLVQATPLAKAQQPAPKLPRTIQGLTVKQEDISKTVAQDTRQLYVSGVWLFSLRKGKELMATIEIGKFDSTAPWKSSDFDISLANQLGGSVPAVIRVDGVPVYVSTTRGLELVSWFRGGYMYILGIRNTYPSPKDLLRKALEVV